MPDVASTAKLVPPHTRGYSKFSIGGCFRYRSQRGWRFEMQTESPFSEVISWNPSEPKPLDLAQGDPVAGAIVEPYGLR